VLLAGVFRLSVSLRSVRGCASRIDPAMASVPPKRYTPPAWADVLASSVAGSATAVVITPFDVVTRRVQAHDFRNSRAALVGLVRHEGLSSLLRGLSPTLIMFASTNALYFPCYERLRNAIDDAEVVSAQWTPLFAGTSARAVTAALSSPMEYVRTNMQTHAGAAGNGAVQVFRRIAANGPLSLWRGLAPTLWRDVPYSAVYWYLVERIRITYGGPDRTQHAAWLHLAAGSTSGLVSSLLTHPFDVIKTQMQLEIGRGARAGLLSTGRAVVAARGWTALWRGLGPRVSKIVPASAVMLSTFEFVRAHVSREQKV